MQRLTIIMKIQGKIIGYRFKQHVLKMRISFVIQQDFNEAEDFSISVTCVQKKAEKNPLNCGLEKRRQWWLKRAQDSNLDQVSLLLSHLLLMISHLISVYTVLEF